MTPDEMTRISEIKTAVDEALRFRKEQIIINPILESIAREVAEEEGLHELAKLYPAQGYVLLRRSRGWRVSRYRKVRE